MRNCSLFRCPIFDLRSSIFDFRCPIASLRRTICVYPFTTSGYCEERYASKGSSADTTGHFSSYCSGSRTSSSMSSGSRKRLRITFMKSPVFHLLWLQSVASCMSGSQLRFMLRHWVFKHAAQICPHSYHPDGSVYLYHRALVLPTRCVGSIVRSHAPQETCASVSTCIAAATLVTFSEQTWQLHE